MKRYCRMPAETPTAAKLGTGWLYVEFDGDWATRQVEVYGDHSFWTSVDRPYLPEMGIKLVDQPLSRMDPGPPIEEITPDEFDAAWGRATRA